MSFGSDLGSGMDGQLDLGSERTIDSRPDLDSGMDSRPDLGLGRTIDSRQDLGLRRSDFWPPARSGECGYPGRRSGWISNLAKCGFLRNLRPGQISQTHASRAWASIQSDIRQGGERGERVSERGRTASKRGEC
jgi:hypothetical protein